MTKVLNASGSFGEFDDYLCWTSVSVCDRSFEIYEACTREGSSCHDRFAEDEIRLAIAEIGAIYHENRHVQDVFGTPAGLSVVFGFWDCVLRFLRAAAEMKRDGRNWRLPLPVRAGTDKNALLQLRGFLISRQLYDTPFLPTRVETEKSGFVRKDEVGLANRGLGAHAVVYEVTAGDAAALNGAPDGASTSVSVAMPLGFEAFLEGQARSVEAARLVVAGFPAGLVLSVLHAPVFADILDVGVADALERLPEVVLPYDTTKDAIESLLAARGLSLYDVDPSLSLKLHEVMLIENELMSDDLDGTVMTVIPDFGACLKGVVERHSVEALRAGEVFASPESVERLEHWRDRMVDVVAAASDEEPDSGVTNVTDLSVLRWRLYLAAHFALPMLHRRRKLNDDPRVDEEMQRRLAAALPHVEAYKSAALSSFDEPTRFYFWHVAFLIEILRQALDGGPVIRCPHRSRRLPFADGNSNFARDGTCRRWITLGCGTFDPGARDDSIPDCVFESVLSDCGFRRGGRPSP